jgi:predicted  nucleic acid-binding Zn-ribbon protein
MTWQASLNKAFGALKKDEQRLERELDELRRKIESLSGVTRSKGARKARGARKMSAAGRAAISRAAKKRWAAYRKAKK